MPGKRMEISLTLKDKCVQTTGEKTYEALMRAYFDKKTPGREKQSIENRLAALSVFLEKADFPGLRAAFPELDPSPGSPETLLTLRIGENPDQIELRFNGKTALMGDFLKNRDREEK
ncbi:hypothetical protein EPICR_60004 [Candidatus Desulfarcum epimagneticum]|uniref:Uncharacterized protein n=1 Tax=uncultured Desulfobacteraceae bacterium TaxID=218296 RepID=A0A484HN78_9BACT|nr:hypothetical protein EPICR_60004 [uncultured Desulfobacteraceae bacterium]